MDEAATQEAIRWAQTYNGYQRLAQDPGRLGALLEPARHEYRRNGQVPEWCGVDLLRGWAFYLYRADYFCGGGTLDDEWLAVLDTLSRHPHAERDDRPPPFGSMATDQGAQTPATDSRTSSSRAGND